MITNERIWIWKYVFYFYGHQTFLVLRVLITFDLLPFFVQNLSLYFFVSVCFLILVTLFFKIVFRLVLLLVFMVIYSFPSCLFCINFEYILVKVVKLVLFLSLSLQCSYVCLCFHHNKFFHLYFFIYVCPGFILVLFSVKD